MNKLIFYLLTIIELPFIALTWVDYCWNLLWKYVSELSVIFVLLSLLTIPLTWINGLILASLIFLKNNLIGIKITYSEAVEQNLSRFPEL